MALVLAMGSVGSGCAGASPPPPSAAPVEAAAPGELGSEVAISAARLYTAGGSPAGLDEVVAAAAAADVDVIFVGERHGDVAMHRLQLALLEALLDGAILPERDVVLSLEMFETDVQLVLDEYLAGLISEEHFLAAARPWPNYRRDYRPLVERAREAGIRVVAANAPRRYVNRVARLGREALDDLPDASAAYLPPLPYVGPTEAYRLEWNERMEALARAHGGVHTMDDSVTAAHDHAAHDGRGAAAAHGTGGTGETDLEDPALEAQALWDATMAHSIHRALECAGDTPGAGEPAGGEGCDAPHARPLVLHLTGSFHVENRTGTPEALQHYRPEVRDLVLTVRAVGDPADFGELDHTGNPGELADFILLSPSSSTGGHP
jgi:uncharacterized iron-regulated protein